MQPAIQMHPEKQRDRLNDRVLIHAVFIENNFQGVDHIRSQGVYHQWSSLPELNRKYGQTGYLTLYCNPLHTQILPKYAYDRQ